MSWAALLSGRSHVALRGLAATLRSGACPLELQELVLTMGVLPAAMFLDGVAEEREGAERRADRRLELVWSGPEKEGAATRDTAVVVRELFSSAEQSVLVSGYVVYKGEIIFRPLVERMWARPHVRVDLYLNIQRPKDSTESDDTIVERFRHNFFKHEWPWPERPHVYYDARAMAVGGADRAVLHAKCVVVDHARAFVTSANLTDAAQYRNIECGVLVNDELFAATLARQFEGLRAHGILRRLEE
jgi:phosphatidylserine/phosphatidylglycerophosphate/cardiolipin synthase-like enzyme